MARGKRGYRKRYGRYVSPQDNINTWINSTSNVTRGGNESEENDSRTFKHESHSCELRAELGAQRKTGEFVDVVVEVEGRTFPCHRAVLASVPYFKTMLSCNLAESHSRTVRLQGIIPNSFSKILDFVYKGEICIGIEDVQDILQAAHMLQFDKILKYCEVFIQENLCTSNCAGVMLLADMYGFSDLKNKAQKEMVSNFSDVRQNDEFLNLPTEELLDLLTDNTLRVMSEEDIVHSVIRWLDHGPENRKTAVSQILPAIRLSYVRASLLRKLESHPLVRQSAESLSAITAAKEKMQLPADNEEDGARTKPRPGTSDDLAIIVGGWKAVNRPFTPSRWRMVPWTRESIWKAFHSRRHTVNSKPPDQHKQATPGTPNFPTTSASSRAEVDQQHQPVDSPPVEQPIAMRSIICLDPNARQYYHITDLPMPVLGYMSVAVAKGRLYITGGRAQPLVGEGPHTAPIKQVSCYDFPTDTWSKLPDMPRGRAGHQSVVVDGKLFLVGGDTDDTSALSMDCYDLEKDAWIKPPTSPAIPAVDPSSRLTVSGRGGTIVVIEATTIIEERRKLPKRRHDLPIIIYYRKLRVHALDIKTQKWTYLELKVDTADSTREPSDVFVIAVDDTFYFFSAELFGDELYDPTMYAYDVSKKTLRTDVEEEVGFAGHFIRTSRNRSYVDGQAGVADTLVNPKIEGKDSTVSWRTALPVALFGHGFLLTKKSETRWYCRDLKKLQT
ncbi:kelch repeat and BTB domain-containing protein 12-like [Branchiostoma floridae x Branchiostoma japonicum]